ncbi:MULTISPECIES: hypothetical protein, partial [unclassified Microcoleus]|uniref:hypothetical protein n=1 Tax=unclassified Microcoleus TaxID=2642155 RepID=UPI002FCFAF7A
IIVKNRQDACSTKKKLVFLWGGHLARPKLALTDILYHCQEQARCLFHKEKISFLVGRASCPPEISLN